jgi:hypothetical protein
MQRGKQEAEDHQHEHEVQDLAHALEDPPHEREESGQPRSQAH